MIGKFINERYQIETLLGRGGMGSVYRAADLVQNRLVALKFLDLYRGSQTEMILTRFQREFRVLTRLNHPRIVQAYEFGTYEGTPYLVLEYLAGVTLADEIASAPLPRARSLLIARQICEPLAYLHTQAIVHRDLKPDNLMLMSTDDDTVESGLKLMDFGLAHQADFSIQLTQEGVVLGTVAYMAPEQAQGFPVDFRTDLYALGAILYQMVTGRPPFMPNNPAVMLMQLLTGAPPPPHQLNPKVDEPLERLIMRLLAKEPSERPPNVEGVAAQLAQLADERGPALSPVTATALDPHRIDLIPRAPLIGRETALAELLQYWTTARSGQGQVVLLSGLAGVGKTRLLDEAKPRVQLEQGWIVRSHCQDQAALPYQPILNILETLLQRLPATVRESLPPELTRLLPGARNYSFSNLDSTDQAEARRRLFTACWEVIKQAAQKQALQLVLEDLQWLDPASQELLDYLIEQVGQARLLLILTYRPEEFDPTTTLASLRRGLGHQQIAHTIKLKLLTREQVARFLQSALSWNDAPAWLIDNFYQATDGNPLFIEETLKALAAEGQVAAWIRQGSSQSRKVTLSGVGLQLPQNILALAQRRLQLLTDEDRAILTTAAVLGPEFLFALLEAMTKLNEDDLLDAVERLLAARLIEELPLQAGEDRYRFAQEALRQALLTTISQRRLRTLHRRAGEAIEQVYRDVQRRTWPVLAHHFGQAGEAQKTIKYSILAGDAAADIYANLEAIGYYRQALALLEPTESSNPPLAHLYSRLGRTLELNAQFDEALATYQEMETVAQQVQDRKMLLTALTAQAGLRVRPTSLFDAAQGELLLKKALELTQELADQVIEVQTLWNLLHVYRFTNGLLQAIEVGEQALALARKNNLREQMAFILNDLGRCYIIAGHLNQAKETTLETITLWRELHNLPMQTDSLAARAQILYYSGEYDQAIVCMEEALQISQSIANVWGQSFSQTFLGRVYWERGLPAQAIAVMKDCIQLGVSIDFIGPQLFTQADLAIVYGSLGAIEQGLESARLAVTAASKAPHLVFMRWLLWLQFIS